MSRRAFADRDPEQRPAGTQGGIAFDLDAFEYVTATAGMVLLRLSGRWTAKAETRLKQPQLVVKAGRRRFRVAPLPAGGDGSPMAGPGGLEWRGG